MPVMKIYYLCFSFSGGIAFSYLTVSLSFALIRAQSGEE